MIDRKCSSSSPSPPSNFLRTSQGNVRRRNRHSRSIADRLIGTSQRDFASPIAVVESRVMGCRFAVDVEVAVGGVTRSQSVAVAYCRRSPASAERAGEREPIFPIARFNWFPGRIDRLPISWEGGGGIGNFLLSLPFDWVSGHGNEIGALGKVRDDRFLLSRSSLRERET